MPERGGSVQLLDSELENRLAGLTDVSRETIARLRLYVEVLARWQSSKNLVASDTLKMVWSRHILDCLQLLRYGGGALRWCDMGSGAGLPGLVLAIALREKPGAVVHLIESRSGKVAFLREAARLTEAPVLIHQARVEDCIHTLAGEVDIVTARALAPLRVLIDYASCLLKTGAKGLFLKGQDVDKELTEAQKYWILKHNFWPSITDPSARIIEVKIGSISSS